MNIKLAICLICPTFFLTACAQMFPAAVSKIEPGVYVVQATSNLFGSDDAMVNKVDKKAELLCKGKGFIDLSSKSQYQRDYYGAPGYKIFYKRIKCND